MTKKKVDQSVFFDLADTIDCLEYISESPQREYGGFAPQTVRVAKSALKHIKDMQAKIDQKQRRNNV
jgi:hypothetical protein